MQKKEMTAQDRVKRINAALDAAARHYAAMIPELGAFEMEGMREWMEERLRNTCLMLACGADLDREGSTQ